MRSPASSAARLAAAAEWGSNSSPASLLDERACAVAVGRGERRVDDLAEGEAAALGLGRMHVPEDGREPGHERVQDRGRDEEAVQRRSRPVFRHGAEEPR